MLLHKFDGDFQRQRLLDMDGWEMTNVLCRPSTRADAQQGYWPVGRMADPNDPPVKALDHAGVFFHPDRVKAMRTLGMSDAEIQDHFERYRSGKRAVGDYGKVKHG